MLTNGVAHVDQTDHPLAPQHHKSRRLSTNCSQTSVDNNGDVAGNSASRDLLSPSYKASVSDSPYHHDDQLSSGDSGIRSGSYYEKTSIADSAIVGVSDYDDRESSPESGIRLVPPQPERIRNSPKSSVTSNYPLVTSHSSSSLQRAQNGISPSATHPNTNNPHRHRLSVPNYLSSFPHHKSSAWEAPNNSTVIVITHTGKEVASHSAQDNRTSSQQCHQSTPQKRSIQFVSAQPAASDVTEDSNNVTDGDNNSTNNESKNDDDDSPRCVDIAWPKSWKRRLLYPILFPLIILLYFTLPNVNKPVSYGIYVFDMYLCI